MINEHKRRTDILVLGLEGVGKSLLIKKLKGIIHYIMINLITKGINEKSKEEIGFETNPTVRIFLY
jgi:GTPase SAR1 family protein